MQYNQAIKKEKDANLRVYVMEKRPFKQKLSGTVAGNKWHHSKEAQDTTMEAET